jgi:tetratricopeptide (TPR) repeat protein
MASDKDKRAKSSHGEVPASCLSTLCKRPQLDFEIEFFERILSRDPNYVEVLSHLGDLFSRKECHRRALQVDLRLARLRPRCPTVFYNLACSHAVLNHTAPALDALERAVALGYRDLDFLLTDPDLSTVRFHPRFRKLLAEVEGAAATRLA